MVVPVRFSMGEKIVIFDIGGNHRITAIVAIKHSVPRTSLKNKTSTCGNNIAHQELQLDFP
jgi:hypothetical protein